MWTEIVLLAAGFIAGSMLMMAVGLCCGRRLRGSCGGAGGNCACACAGSGSGKCGCVGGGKCECKGTCGCKCCPPSDPTSKGSCSTSCC